MNSMIYNKGDGVKYFNVCPACPRHYPIGDDGAEPNDDTIPVYYSEQEATDNGWMPTTDIRFCPPDKNFTWVCPDCWPIDAA